MEWEVGQKALRGRQRVGISGAGEGALVKNSGSMGSEMAACKIEYPSIFINANQ